MVNELRKLADPNLIAQLESIRDKHLATHDEPTFRCWRGCADTGFVTYVDINGIRWGKPCGCLMEARANKPRNDIKFRGRNDDCDVPF